MPTSGPIGEHARLRREPAVFHNVKLRALIPGDLAPRNDLGNQDDARVRAAVVYRRLVDREVACDEPPPAAEFLCCRGDHVGDLAAFAVGTVFHWAWDEIANGDQCPETILAA